METPYAFFKNGSAKKTDFNMQGSPSEKAEFLKKDENMKGAYLGLCLDSCRWGGQTTVMWEMSATSMVDFIKNWMNQNKRNFENLFNEKKIEEMWVKFELPHINFEECPKDKSHKETIEDMAGRKRCGHVDKIPIKKNFFNSYDFFDKESQIDRLAFYDDSPIVPLETDGLHAYYGVIVEAYSAKKEAFDNDEFEDISDACYRIISDKNLVLSLEKIIKRMNLRPEYVTKFCRSEDGPLLDKCNIEKNNPFEGCMGHDVPVNKVELSFDGRGLAYYVQRWYEQFEDKNNLLFFEK